MLLAGCGKKERWEGTWQGIAPGTDDLTAVTERTEYYDVTVESEELFDLGLWEKNPQDKTPENAMFGGCPGYLLIGTQFYHGEPVQLWAELSSKGTDIYLYRKDGTRELLLDNMPSTYTRSGARGFQWYLGRDGDFYCYNMAYPATGGEYKSEGTIVKILSTGEIQYTSTLDDFVIQDLCQTGDNRIFLLLKEWQMNRYFLAKLDPASGTVSDDFRMELPYEFDVNLGTAGTSPAVTGQNRGVQDRQIVKADTAVEGLSPVLYFAGTSYGWHDSMTLQDLQVLEDGRAELLWTGRDGHDCLWEGLKMEKVEKVPIVVRGIKTDDWLGIKTSSFNAENSTYHVVLESCGSGNDGDEFSRLTSVQVGSGKGPDILCGDIGLDYIAGMLEKGALEDLAPYMKASGIREEDYFPLAFSGWRTDEKIYGVNYRMKLSGSQIDEEVLGGRGTPDIVKLTDALLTWEGNGIYMEGYGPGAVLEALLQGTDSLWGMVDWEDGWCDFSTPLFGRLLEAARRYGDDGRSTAGSAVIKSTDFDSLFWFDGRAEREADGRSICGVLFDDGCHAAFSSDHILAVNANSPNKEGAWEFISYLISEKCQSKDSDNLMVLPPVHRKAFDTWQQKVIENYALVHYVNGIERYPAYYGTDLSEEKKAEYLRAIEEAKPLPIRTAPILKIILDEAEAYFDGYKSVDEISRVINNRVQLYLDERK